MIKNLAVPQPVEFIVRYGPSDKPLWAVEIMYNLQTKFPCNLNQLLKQHLCTPTGSTLESIKLVHVSQTIKLLSQLCHLLVADIGFAERKLNPWPVAGGSLDLWSKESNDIATHYSWIKCCFSILYNCRVAPSYIPF